MRVRINSQKFAGPLLRRTCYVAALLVVSAGGLASTLAQGVLATANSHSSMPGAAYSTPAAAGTTTQGLQQPLNAYDPVSANVSRVRSAANGQSAPVRQTSYVSSAPAAGAHDGGPSFNGSPFTDERLPATNSAPSPSVQSPPPAAIRGGNDFGLRTLPSNGASPDLAPRKSNRLTVRCPSISPPRCGCRMRGP